MLPLLLLLLPLRRPLRCLPLRRLLGRGGGPSGGGTGGCCCWSWGCCGCSCGLGAERLCSGRWQLLRQGWRAERRRDRWLLLLVLVLLRLLLGLLLLLPVLCLLLQCSGLRGCQLCHQLQQLLQLRRGLRWRLLFLLCLLRCCLQLLQQLGRLLRGGVLLCTRYRRRFLCRCRRRTGLLLLRLHHCRRRLCSGRRLGTCAALLERWLRRTGRLCRHQPSLCSHQGRQLLCRRSGLLMCNLFLCKGHRQRLHLQLQGMHLLCMAVHLLPVQLLQVLEHVQGLGGGLQRHGRHVQCRIQGGLHGTVHSGGQSWAGRTAVAMGGHTQAVKPLCNRASECHDAR